jgi:DNA topoisomerase-3
MTGISRYVKNPEIRKILRETDGLGTEATRASIIELLFKRGYLIRQNKQILSTSAGRGLIQSLPETATSPDMTAEWELNLNAISARQRNYEAFMRPLIQSVTDLIDHAKLTLPSSLKNVNSPKGKFNKRRRRKS